MKIALVIEHFDATRGGAEHLAVWIAGELVKRGHEVHVVCHDVSSRVNRYRQATLRASYDARQSRHAHPSPDVAHDGLHLHRLRGVRLTTALGLRLFGRRARQWCRRHRPDVAHSLTVAFAGDVYHAYAGVYAAMQEQAAAMRADGRGHGRLEQMITRLRGRQRTLLALERRALTGTNETRAAGARRVVSLCGMTTRQFAQYFPEEVRKIVELDTPRLVDAVPSASQEQAAERRAWFRGLYRLKPEDRVALFAGHDFRRKGLRYAIEAVARTKSGWKLIVVGMGKAREYVELADALGIGDAGGAGQARVLFVGPTQEMSAVYAASDALLLPAFYEPSAMLTMEALAHGLPVISTEFLGAGELVRRHEAGTIVGAPRDVEALAAALDALPRRGTPQQRALEARARAAGAGIAPAVFVDALLAIYRQVQSG